MLKPQPWKQVSSRVLDQTPWMKIIADDVITPTGKPGKYTYAVTPPFVLMIPRNDRGHILLVRQLRYTTGREFWELPAGAADEGETLEAAARRELGEEAGLTADSWTVLGDIYESVSLSYTKGTVLLAEDLTDAPELLSPEDGILEQRWFSLNELGNMTAKGQLPDSKTLAALYLAQQHGH